MTYFLAAATLSLAIDVGVRLICIAKRELPERTWGHYVGDLVWNAALLAWAVHIWLGGVA